MKKNTGKIVSVILIAAMALAMTACSKSKVPEKYKYDLSKYVKLGEYDGLTYTKQDRTVTDQDVRNEIESMLYDDVVTEEVREGVVGADSVVNFDYVGSIDGVEFEGGTDQGAEDDMADSRYIPGFAEQIIGHKVGDTFDIKVTFPDPYDNNPDLSGKQAVFKITINHLVKKTLPEYNDEYVKNHTDYETVEEYEAALREHLAEDKETDAESAERSEVFQKILNESEIIEYPEKELNEKVAQIKSTYEEYAAMYGMEYKDFLEQFMLISEEEFDQEVLTAAQETVRQELVLYALAKDCGVTVSNKEYSDFLDSLLEEAGITREEFEDEYGQTIDQYAEDYDIYTSYLYDKVMEEVMKKCVAQ